MTTRILVCGGRTFANAARLTEALDSLHSRTPVTHLIHGDARGADRLAAQWAASRGIPTTPYPAAWDDLDTPGARIRWNPATRRPYNAAAGAQRNARMLREGRPDLVVAFAENAGPGTANMVAQSLKSGLAVLTVEE